MRKHHAFRFAGAARGVEDRSHVGIDDPMVARRRCAKNIAPTMHRRPGGVKLRHRGAGDDDVLQLGATGEHGAEALQPSTRRDEDSDSAVTQDVADLFGLQQGVDRHEHGPVGRRAE